jgi:hypothetical protein
VHYPTIKPASALDRLTNTRYTQNARAKFNSSSHQNKENKVHINIRPEMNGFLTLIERLHSTASTLATQHFAYNRHNTLTTHVHNLTTAEFLLSIKSQFTTNSKMFTWINARIYTSDDGLSQSIKCPGAVANCLTRAKKRVGDVSLHFQIHEDF